MRHWRKMCQQAGDPERTMVRAITRAYGYGDDWKKRAEAAEKALAAVPWVALHAVIERQDDISDWNQARAWVDDNHPQSRE